MSEAIRAGKASGLFVLSVSAVLFETSSHDIYLLLFGIYYY